MKNKILIVDDTVVNLTILFNSLREDYEIDQCRSGQEALNLATIKNYDLIILDVLMPKMDGIETYKKIKEIKGYQKKPIIFITASNDTNSERKGLEEGAADFIVKPFHIDLVKFKIKNIIQISELNETLKRKEEQLRLVLEATGDGIWDWDLRATEIQHSEKWKQIIGCKTDKETHNLIDYINLIHKNDREKVKNKIAQFTNKKNKSDEYKIEYQLNTGSKKNIWIEDIGKVVSRDSLGYPTRIIGSIKDITLRKKQEEQITYLAFHDPLTNLANRALFIEKLKHTVNQSKRTGKRGAVLFIDLDGFKKINDTLGHSTGDKLLQEVAKRLTLSVRKTDTVSRFGGDEFVILLDSIGQTDMESEEHAMKVTNQIHKILCMEYKIKNIISLKKPSIGIYIFNDQDDNIDKIIGYADKAMYRSKNSETRKISFFHSETESHLKLIK